MCWDTGGMLKMIWCLICPVSRIWDLECSPAADAHHGTLWVTGWASVTTNSECSRLLLDMYVVSASSLLRLRMCHLFIAF